MTRVVCFDLDDTLYPEAEYVESGLRAVGAGLPRIEGREAGEWFVEAWRGTRAPDLFQRAAAAVGLGQADVERMKATYREHTPAIRAWPWVAELALRLTREGRRLAVVSDGYLDVQRRKWAALALPPVFDPVVFTDERGRAYWKPHPWGFERVMESCPDAEYVYVADNPAKDFIAPAQLGWRTIMFRHAAGIHPEVGGVAADERADTYEDLARLIL